VSMSSKVVIATQVAGAVAVSIGVGLIFLPAGIIAAGVFSILFGIALERTDAK
jgi:hypothetical protein